MTAEFIGSLADSFIMVCAGAYFTFSRQRLVSRIADLKKKERTEKILQIAGPLLLGCGLLLGAGKVLRAEDELTKIAHTISASAPRMADDVTRIDGAVAGPGQRLTVNVTIISLAAADIDRSTWTTKLLPKLREQLARSEFARMVGSGVTIVYRYSGKDAALIDEVVVPPATMEKK